MTVAASTFGNEDALPRIPLPGLEASCARFREWCAPLLTADERAATDAAVAEFLAPGSAAHILQAALADYDASPGVHSWLDTFWPYRYLGRRDRIALNANFFFLFNDTGEGQLDRAAGIIAGAIGYKQLIDSEQLAPAQQRGRPLSMEQNRYLFSSTRIPGALIDSARTPYSDEWPGPSRERHIVVFHHGAMFRMDVIGAGGRPHSTADLRRGLQAVLDASPEPAPVGTSVGHLTTNARADWAASREALRALDPANVTALDIVETALFCLCLEDGVPADPLAAGDQLLHGDSGNRWFDKALSFIVFADGTAGFNGEHCNLDGTTVISLIDTLLTHPSHEHARRAGAQSQGRPEVAAIDFVLDDALRADITGAAESFAAYAAGTATTTVSVAGFGADTAKALGVSPDAFAQLVFQLAHRRTKGLIGATYESIAMHQYRNGRTEAMRVVSPEIVRFAEAMDDPHTDTSARAALARAAADQHVARARECQAGDAPEQHLWELQLIQQRRGRELGADDPLALYDSPGWRIMRDDYLSTSSVPSVNVQYWGFGSTSDKCIGVAYALLPDAFRLYLSTPRTVGAQLMSFADALPAAVHDLTILIAEGTG